MRKVQPRSLTSCLVPVSFLLKVPAVFSVLSAFFVKVYLKRSFFSPCIRVDAKLIVLLPAVGSRLPVTAPGHG